MTLFITHKQKIAIQAFFTQALFISLIAILAMGFASFFYLKIDHAPQIDWGVTGRWIAMVARGQFFTPNINQEPVQAHEWLIGFASHDIISFIFALTYLFSLKYVFKTTPSLFNGWLFGLTAMIMPFFIQHPAMGTGILGLATANPVSTILSTIFYHSSFGLGLGLGSRWYQTLHKTLSKRAHTDRQ